LCSDLLDQPILELENIRQYMATPNENIGLKGEGGFVFARPNDSPMFVLVTLLVTFEDVYTISGAAVELTGPKQLAKVSQSIVAVFSVVPSE
jgi:hypothetical protein